MSPASSPVNEDVADAISRAATPLPSPRALADRYQLSATAERTIRESRTAIRRILAGADARFLVVVGPCSIHDTDAALDYAERLVGLQRRLDDRMLIVMRAYLEKPRTTIGWRGFLNDPHLDGSYDMVEGLRRSRCLLTEIAAMGLPMASELLDITAAPYFTDLLSFAGIGARTSESQPHRALASGYPAPVGFKNGTDGCVQVALDGQISARESHSYLGMDDEGRCCVQSTLGNPDTLLILRGGRVGPNYAPECVQAAQARMGQLGLPPALMVDCSHANSSYDPAQQPVVCASVARQRRAGNRALIGVMLESNLYAGKQNLVPGDSTTSRRYGVSVTDACMDWETTEALLEELHTTLDA